MTIAEMTSLNPVIGTIAGWVEAGKNAAFPIAKNYIAPAVGVAATGATVIIAAGSAAVTGTLALSACWCAVQYWKYSRTTSDALSFIALCAISFSGFAVATYCFGSIAHVAAKFIWLEPGMANGMELAAGKIIDLCLSIGTVGASVGGFFLICSLLPIVFDSPYNRAWGDSFAKRS